jgi:hypothetical protein
MPDEIVSLMYMGPPKSFRIRYNERVFNVDCKGTYSMGLDGSNITVDGHKYNLSTL